MGSWDYFQNRWNHLQSADIARNAVDLATLTAELAELEKFMVYVVANAALGQPLSSDDPVVRGFLKLAAVDDPRRALLELVANIQHQHRPRVVTCPKCGAGVRDLVGVTDERCQFCGTTLSTRD